MFRIQISEDSSITFDGAHLSVSEGECGFGTSLNRAQAERIVTELSAFLLDGNPSAFLGAGHAQT